MADHRTIHSVLLDLETVYFDVTPLASAIEVIGTNAKTEGLETAAGAGVEVLGEVLSSRDDRLGSLLIEANTLASARA